MKIVRKIPQDDWLDLITRSHQTSLFMLPEWLSLHRDELDILAAYDTNGKIAAGLVSSLVPDEHTFVPYRGLLMTRREMPGVVRALLAETEKVEGHVHITNAPSLVDILPFQWRWHEADKLWSDSVRYTMFFDRNSRPFHDLDPSSEPTPISGSVVVEQALRLLVDSVGGHAAELERLSQLESTQLWSDDDNNIVLWGTDLQDRGYFIAGTPKCSGLVVELAKRHERGAELYGCNSPLMNRRKRVYGAQKRTYYRLDLRQ